MRYTTDDLRIKEIRELTPPAHLIREFPCEEPFARTVHGARMAAHEILHGHDDRLLVIVGPCSIHDPKAAMEYAQKLNEERRRLAGDLEIIMRVYFEKPRTTVGWKGLMNDPDMDGSCRINHGLRIARELLCDIVALGLPTGVEYLDMIGEPSAHAQPNLSRIASLPAVCPALSVSKTAPTATSRSPLTPSAPPNTPTHSCRLPRAASRPLSPRPETKTVTSFSEAEKSPITTPKALPKPVRCSRPTATAKS